MVWNGNFPTRLRMAPNLVTARARAIKAKAKNAKTPGDFTISKSSEAAHQGIMTGTRNSRVGAFPLRKTAGSGSPCSRQDSTILRARP